MNDQKCQKTVHPQGPYSSFHGHKCTRKIWKDGYCRIHHPDTVKAKQEAASKEIEEAIAAKRKAWNEKVKSLAFYSKRQLVQDAADRLEAYLKEQRIGGVENPVLQDALDKLNNALAEVKE